MKKMNKKEIKKIIEKIKPFWEEYQKIEIDYLKKIRILEQKMNKKIKPKARLEFFYSDGACVGVGAEDYINRKWFPLIHDTELE